MKHTAARINKLMIVIELLLGQTKRTDKIKLDAQQSYAVYNDVEINYRKSMTYSKPLMCCASVEHPLLKIDK